MKNLLSVSDLTDNQIKKLILTAKDLKTENGISKQSLKNKSLALLFEKPSLRTRASFELGITQLGGHCGYLSKDDIGMGNREPVVDIANVLDIYPLTGKVDDPGDYYTDEIGLPANGGFLSSGYYDRPWYYSTPREINFLIQIDYK